jgi:hypothetical protein
MKKENVTLSRERTEIGGQKKQKATEIARFS